MIWENRHFLFDKHWPRWGPPFDNLTLYFMEWVIHQYLFYQMIFVELKNEQDIPRLAGQNQIVFRSIQYGRFLSISTVGPVTWIVCITQWLSPYFWLSSFPSVFIYLYMIYLYLLYAISIDCHGYNCFFLIVKKIK